MAANPNPPLKVTPAKAILAAVGQVAALGTCIGTNAPPWLSAIIGIASVVAVYRIPNRPVAPPSG